MRDTLDRRGGGYASLSPLPGNLHGPAARRAVRLSFSASHRAARSFGRSDSSLGVGVDDRDDGPSGATRTAGSRIFTPSTSEAFGCQTTGSSSGSSLRHPSAHHCPRTRAMARAPGQNRSVRRRPEPGRPMVPLGYRPIERYVLGDERPVRRQSQSAFARVVR